VQPKDATSATMPSERSSPRGCRLGARRAAERCDVCDDARGIEDSPWPVSLIDPVTELPALRPECQIDPGSSRLPSPPRPI
jgi:hypothetical protein